MRRCRLIAALPLMLSACIVYPPGSLPGLGSAGRGAIPPAEPPPAAGGGAVVAAGGGDNPAAGAGERFTPWADALKDSRRIDGLFTTHLKRDRGLLVEIAPAQLDRDHGLALRFSRGLGDFDVQHGMPIGDVRLVRFRRVADRIELVQLNPRFTAPAGSGWSAGLERNLGHATLASFPIVSEHADSRNVLIDATSFLVSDFAEAGEWMQAYFDNVAPSLESDRSYIEHVAGFPRNLEIDALLTYRASKPPVFGGAGVADHRAMPVGVRYSLLALPEEPLRPRYADPRVGHFVTAVWDFSLDREPSPYHRYVQRWRLQRQDPAATRSPPVQPIVFWIDGSVPAQYRGFVREGIEAWNRAFDAAGFRDAIVARDAPGDASWSPDDVRHSVVRWTPGYNMYYAVAPSQADPRTGEILNAQVLVSAALVAFWQDEYAAIASPVARVREFRDRLAGGPYLAALRARGAAPGGDAGPYGVAFRSPLESPPEPAGRVPLRAAALERACHAQLGTVHQLRTQHALLAALGVIDAGAPMPERFLGDAVRDLVMHEVGHALGLRHNFRASASVPYDRLHDLAWTAEHGVTGSVMDYPTVNLSPDPARQGHYWNQGVGSYDFWAIRYAYEEFYTAPPATRITAAGVSVVIDTTVAEREALRAHAALAADPRHAYATDEDTWLGPWSLDPAISAWDIGSDPLRHAADRSAIIRRAIPQLEQRLVAPGDGYERLRRATTTLILERMVAVYPVTRIVGGVSTSRAHRGDPGGAIPFTPVPAEWQRAAVRLIADEILAENAWRFPPDLVNRLAPDRWNHWGTPAFTVPVDYPLHDMIALVQSIFIEELLDPVRIGRLVENRMRGGAPGTTYQPAELFDAVAAAAWSELDGRAGRPRNIDSVRRNVQRAHIAQLSRLLHFGASLGSASVYEDTRAHARVHLLALRERLERAGAADATAGLDADSRAHLLDALARVRRALDVTVTVPAR
jgi:hypothetical protein